MTQIIGRGIHVWSAMLICFILAFVYLGCSPKTEISIVKNSTLVQSDSDDSACIDVSGYVLGDIITNSSVYLYNSLSTDYETVMMTVRTAEPIRIGRVNDYAEFDLPCLSYGKYVVSIPSKSYANKSVGSPLPYEIKTETVSLNIVFHGGDSQYLVGVFIIDTISD